MTKRKSSRSRSRSSSKSRSSRSRSKSKKKTQPSLWQRLTWDQKLDILGWVLVALSFLTILSMASADQGSLTSWWLAVLSQAFGWGRFVVPLFTGAVGLWLVLRHFGERIPTLDPEQIVGIFLGFFFLLTTMHLVATRFQPAVDSYLLGQQGRGGGWLGAVLLDVGVEALGLTGVVLTLLIGWLVVLTFLLGISPAEALHFLIARLQGQPISLADFRTAPGASAAGGHEMPLPGMSIPTGTAEEEEATTRAAPKILGGKKQAAETKQPTETEKKQKKAPARKQEAEDFTINAGGRATNGTREVDIAPLEVGTQAWRLPSVKDILEEGSEQYYSEDLIRKQVRIIEETLESLGAPVRVREINQGPVITQFGAEPLFLTSRSGKTTKVKVSKIASLADDLSLALSARSIRIQAPIPGKGLVGVEVPNEEAALVSLRDAMESEEFADLEGRLRLGLGQDVSGGAVAADLRSMPHLLIAGATGAGKSVCVNSIIAALLLQNSPDTLRLILVDPKRVELTQYNGIPHLLAPVIVDVERVVPVLRWVSQEMDSRYRRFAAIGARNIDDYNQRVKKSADQDPIPYISVLVDELADLMMQAPEETERVICRLAQMSRATGIHLIIATQRPSVDVVTGLIKANFPARIAFAVASSVDSRVILDTPGAERLLGRGDMLFMPPDVSQPLRLQGAFVSDRELERLISFWRKAVEPGKEVKSLISAGPSVAEVASQPSLFPTFDELEAEMEFEDELLPSAVEIFLAENRASTSLLQRRLRIGYTRAARLVDILTDMGIVTEERQGQFRKVNRAVAEELLRSVNPQEDRPPF